MRHTVYWATLDCPSGGVDLFINDIPVVRMGPARGLRRPLNEYARPASNTISVRNGDDLRRPLPASTPLPPDPDAKGPDIVTLRVEAVEFLAGDEIGRATLFEEGAPKLGDRGTTVFEGMFDAAALRGGLPALTDFVPIGPSERAAIMARLAQAAAWWRAGDADSLLAWIDPYVRDFTSSYASEDYEDYRTAFRAMVGDLSGPAAQVSYDPGRVRLELCGGGSLVQCLRDDGRAAVTVSSPEIEMYDFELIAGIRRGEVIALR